MNTTRILVVLVGMLLVAGSGAMGEDAANIHTAAQTGQVERVQELLNDLPELIDSKDDRVQRFVEGRASSEDLASLQQN